MDAIIYLDFNVAVTGFSTACTLSGFAMAAFFNKLHWLFKSNTGQLLHTFGQFGVHAGPLGLDL